MASASPKAMGAMYFNDGSVVSMVGTSHGPPALSPAKAEVNVGTRALNNTRAAHNPPASGKANGRIRLDKANWKRSRARVQGLAPFAVCIRAREAATRSRTVRSEGGVRRG